MQLRTLKEASGAPLGIAKVKAWGKLEGTAEDAILPLMLGAATRLCRAELRGPILPETLELALDRFPCGRGPIDLMTPRAFEVVSITYLDAAGASQILAPERYQLDLYSSPSKIDLAYEQDWPDTRRTPNAVKVQFRAGWTTDDKVPEDIKVWICAHVADLVRNREAFQEGKVEALPYLSALLDQHRLYTFA